MTLYELKKISEESLNLYYDYKIEEYKKGAKRTILFKTAEKNIGTKKDRLQKLESILNFYSFLFETDIKTLKDVIWGELSNDKHIYLTIKSCDDRICKNDLIENKNLNKNKYKLLLCKKIFSISILEFESCEDIFECENTKINLLKEGFIRSSKLNSKLEELERNIPGFQDLMWGIVENNINILNAENIIKKD